MEKSDLRANLKTWLSNLREARKTHFQEGARWDSAAVRYLDGGIEAYQRVLETIGTGSSRREQILDLVASSPTSAFPGWARWESNGISYQDVNDLWCYLNWWEITDYVVNCRIAEPIKRMEASLDRIERAEESRRGDMLKKKP